MTGYDIDRMAGLAGWYDANAVMVARLHVSFHQLPSVTFEQHSSCNPVPPFDEVDDNFDRITGLAGWCGADALILAR
jgi:hypothetical protein